VAAVSDTIVVGYDDREPARDALALARRLARATSARLLVAHVAAFESFFDEIEPRHWERVLGAIRDEAEHAVRAAAEGITDVPARGMTVYGHSAAQALTSLASDEDAQLLVVGSSHHGRLGRVVPGSTAERLLQGSPCPVAVAPRGFAQLRDARLEVIGCGFDGSRESHAALAREEALVRVTAARLEVVAVFTPIAFGGTPLWDPDGVTTANEELRVALRDALDSAAANLHGDVAAQAELVDGTDAAEILAERSQGLDLLVVGSRRYGPLRAVLLGGVSGRLIRRADCPVLIVPRPGRSPGGGSA
jgi:nucleotide-binding universal stress UspA family protein